MNEMEASQATVSGTVSIKNRQGLHARPADRFVRLALSFDASVTIVKDNQQVDGKSILNLLTLGAEQGTQLEIRTSGTDAEQALAALTALVNSGFDED
ncbi:MAG: HPr family phosphocarrier protein [Planctomycetales bacterium]|nr:HPr family phosphocarrier protein [Planctomycetales bacterium]